MKIFSDKDLTQEITDFDLGIVLAGEEEEFTFYVLNDSQALLQELEFNVEHPEVTISQAPTELVAHGSDKLIIKWKASITVKEGLRAQVSFRGKELWG